MKNIRIEEIGDINSDYPYLEVFLNDSRTPFLEISISRNRELLFKFYVSTNEIRLSLEDWTYIHSNAMEFLPSALKNEDDFMKSQFRNENVKL